VSLAVAGTVFAFILPAELPDKTALARLILGSGYRPGFVFAGVAAFALHVAFAVAVGCLLAALLPHRRWRWWSPSCSWPVHCCSCRDEGATGMTTSV
jgi:putative Ca2+/H+ antiporter (TMEM165/GDT1 family)